MLYLRRIRLALDDLLNNIARLTQPARHLLRRVEPEVKAHRLPHHLFRPNHLVANVEGQQQQAARLQDAPHLGQRGRDLARRDVDNAIERGNARPCPIRLSQRAHVADAKRDVGVEYCGLGQHPRREIDADDRQAAVGQIAADLPRPATHVAHDAPPAQPFGKPVKDGPIQRLAGQLAIDLPRVLVGDAVVTRLCLGSLLVHYNQPAVSTRLCSASAPVTMSSHHTSCTPYAPSPPAARNSTVRASTKRSESVTRPLSVGASGQRAT